MKKWPLVAWLAAVVFILDLASKFAAIRWLKPLGQVEVIPDFLNLTWVMNPGVAFGLMAGRAPGVRVALLTAAAILALVIVFFFIITARPNDRLFVIGLALVVGGAVGNVVDRLRFGAVVDFIDVYYGAFHWPTFNVADIGITIGTGLVIIHLWTRRRE
jgi:signal peptidase II